MFAIGKLVAVGPRGSNATPSTVLISTTKPRSAKEKHLPTIGERAAIFRNPGSGGLPVDRGFLAERQESYDQSARSESIFVVVSNGLSTRGTLMLEVS